MKKQTKAILAAFLMALLAGCATTSTPEHQDPSLPVPSDIKTISDSSEIGFEWASLGDDERIEGFGIYRIESSKNGYNLVGRAADRFATHFVDSGLKPDSEYTYEIRSYTKTSTSAPSKQVSVRTRPTIESVPFSEAIAGLPERVKLIWRPHPDMAVNGYVIERADIEEAKEGKYSHIATIKGRLNAEYIDKSVKSNQTYLYIIYAQTSKGLSKPSTPLKATTKPLPKPISALMASKNEAKKISLSWDYEPFEDFSHFNIYRSSSKFLPYILHDKSKTNNYEDMETSNDATRYYQVSVVDKDGLESKKVEAIGHTLAAPAAPKGLVGAPSATGVSLSWQPVPNAQKYKIYKKAADFDGLLAEVSGTSYTDTRLAPDASFTYNVIAVDSYGLESSKSNTLKIKTNAEF